MVSSQPEHLNALKLNRTSETIPDTCAYDSSMVMSDLAAQYPGPKKFINFSFGRGLVYHKSLKFTYWAAKLTIPTRFWIRGTAMIYFNAHEPGYMP